MTDEEITRRCAEEMGWNDKAKRYGMKIDPLHNDAQAMALLKKFFNRNEMIAMLETEHGFVDGQDLNRCICECVARLK